MPVELSESQYALSLVDLIRGIRRRIWIILIVTTFCVGATATFSLLQTPVYEASIRVLVGQDERNSAPGSLGGDVQGLQATSKTLAEAVESRPVAEATIEQNNLQLTPERFLERLSAEPITETQFLRVSYRDPSPERAQQVANSMGDVFSEQVAEVSPSANGVTATVWERAKKPDEPASPNIVLNIGLALLVGLTLGLGLALLLEYLDDRWRSPEEVEQVSGVPTFGVIPKFEPIMGMTRADSGKEGTEPTRARRIRS